MSKIKTHPSSTMAKKTRSSDKSIANLRSDAKKSVQTFNNLWRTAHKSPGLLKKPKMNGKKRATQLNKKGEEVVVPQRLNKTMRRFPLRVMLSGAAAQVGARLSSEASKLRVDAAGEVNVSGALPAFSRGAEMLVEKFLISYAKTAVANSIAIRDSLKMHKKTTENCMSAACEILNMELQNAAGIAPGKLILTKKTIKKRKAACPEGATDEVAAEA
jgi:hypothetical protein